MSSSARKALVIFELEGCLLYSKMTNSKVIIPGQQNKVLNKKPDSIIKNFEQYHRVGLQKILNSLFIRNRNYFEVGVWSSQNKEMTELLGKSAFGRHYRNLLFVSATKVETLKSKEEIQKESKTQIQSFPIERNLGGVFQKFTQFSPMNTIVISPFKNLIEPYTENDVQLKYFSPQSLGYKFIADFEQVVLSNYLETLKEQAEKQKYEDLRPQLSSLRISYAAERFTTHVHEFGNI